jgi:DNA integrity scanning protein DisA with diadenylate cyclase activity
LAEAEQVQLLLDLQQMVSIHHMAQSMQLVEVVEECGEILTADLVDLAEEEQIVNLVHLVMLEDITQ